MSQLTLHFLRDWGLFLIITPKEGLTILSALTILSPSVIPLKHKQFSEWSCLLVCLCLPCRGVLRTGISSSCSLPYSACSRCSIKCVFDESMAVGSPLCLEHTKLVSKVLNCYKAGRKYWMMKDLGWLVLLWYYVTVHLFSFVPLSLKKLKNNTTQRDISKRWTLKE